MIRAITLHQPWAALVAWGLKQYETRGWSANHRGALAIHSAARFTPEGEAFMATNPYIGKILAERGVNYLDLPLGQVLAIVDLQYVRSAQKTARTLGPVQKSFGGYGPGRFAWFMDPIIELTTKIEARGKQRIWKWDPPPEIQALADQILIKRGNPAGLQIATGLLGVVRSGGVAVKPGGFNVRK